MEIVGRIEEQDILNSCLKSNKAEFVAVYGRRRVGKTYLIKEYFDNRFSFYASGVNKTSIKMQLKNFSFALKDYGLNNDGEIKDWMEAFRLLRVLLEQNNIYREVQSKKRIIFLDEVPWLDGKRSDFKAALDLFWNTYASTQNDLVLIVCGSATSWIINNMIKDEGGFYNRLTRTIHLMPFSLNECFMYSQFLNLHYQKSQVVECYMIFGGIPYYWQLLDNCKSLAQNVDILCFKENGALFYEYDTIFKSLFTKKGKHKDVIEALMKKGIGMQRSELASYSNIGNGKSLTTALNELTECGFIRSYDNYCYNKNGKFFQIIDPFILFAKSFLLNPKFDSWLSYINTPSYYSWSGHAFEILCLNNILAIKKELGISGVMTKECSWRSKISNPSSQIDLLIERKDNVINICEIKYSLGEFEISKDFEQVLLNKIQSFHNETGTKKQLVLTFITLNGLKHNEYSNLVLSEVNIDKMLS